jgi:hypothetical protein
LDRFSGNGARFSGGQQIEEKRILLNGAIHDFHHLKDIVEHIRLYINRIDPEEQNHGKIIKDFQGEINVLFDEYKLATMALEISNSFSLAQNDQQKFLVFRKSESYLRRYPKFVQFSKTFLLNIIDSNESSDIKEIAKEIYDEHIGESNTFN